jgi:hypothetical protein
MSKKLSLEGTADAILLILVTLPLLGSIITIPFCSGPDAGAIYSKCSPAIMQSLSYGISDYITLLGFGGFIVVGPILLIAAIISFVTKVRKFKNGYRPLTARAIAVEIVFAIPLVVVAYLLYLFI